MHFDRESLEIPSTLLTGGLYARCDHRYGDNNKRVLLGTSWRFPKTLDYIFPVMFLPTGNGLNMSNNFPGVRG